MRSLPLQSGTQTWLIRLLTLMLAALAAGSTLFWVLKWPARSEPLRNTLAALQTPAIDTGKIARLLGASQTTDGAAPAAAPINYKLLGVIAQGGRTSKGTTGSALITVDGGLAKPYRIGDVVADGLVLQSVKARSAVLGPEGQTSGRVTLEMPPLPGVASLKAPAPRGNAAPSE